MGDERFAQPVPKFQLDCKKLNILADRIRGQIFLGLLTSEYFIMLEGK